MYSQYRETDFDFPQYQSEESLPNGTVGVPYLENIEVDEQNGRFVEGYIHRKDLPDGMDAYYKP